MSGVGSGEFFDEGEDVFAVFELVAHVVHALFDEEDAEPAYFAVLCGEGGVRIVLFQGIVEHAGVDEGEGGGERFTVEGSSPPQYLHHQKSLLQLRYLFVSIPKYRLFPRYICGTMFEDCYRWICRLWRSG